MSTLSRLESGQRRPTLELLLPVDRAHEVSLDELVEAPKRETPVCTPIETRVHEGYEWLYVLSGHVRLVLGEHDLVLGPGEAAEFDTRVPHGTAAVGPEAG